MDRRSVLRMLAVSGVLLSSLTRKALGQADAAADASLPGASAEAAQSLGLPSDWRFIVPSQWETVDRSLQARLNSPSRDASPIVLGGILLAALCAWLAVARRMSSISVTRADGRACSTSATTPAVSGQENEVPFTLV